MKNKFFLGIVAIAFVTFLTSCGKLPQAEIDAANAAMTEVKASGAEMYLPVEYAAIQDSLKIALENVEKVKSKFLFRNYDEPKAQLEAVNALATKVKENTEIRKNEVKTEAQNTLTEVQTLLQENKDLLVKAPRGKEGAAALDAIKNELTVLETSVGEVNTLLTNGDFLAALDKVKAIKEKAVSINTELKEAIAKTKRR